MYQTLKLNCIHGKVIRSECDAHSMRGDMFQSIFLMFHSQQWRKKRKRDSAKINIKSTNQTKTISKQ